MKLVEDILLDTIRGMGEEYAKLSNTAMEWKRKAEEAEDKASMWETTCIAEERRRVQAETAFEDERARHYEAVRQVTELQSKLTATAQVAWNHQNRADNAELYAEVLYDLALEMYTANAYLNEQLSKAKAEKERVWGWIRCRRGWSEVEAAKRAVGDINSL